MSGSNVDKLEKFRAGLGGDHVALPCNLSDGAAVDALVPQAVEAFGGKLDILVNNAGITRDNLAMRMKDEEWDEVIRVNLEAAFRLMRAAAKPMMRARFGRIISVTSVVGVTGNPGQANYVAAKAGLIGLSKAMAKELATRGITVNCRRAGLHDVGDDRCAERAAAGQHPVAHPDGLNGQRRGYRRRGGLSRQPRGRLRHWTNAARERRNGHDLTCVPAGRQRMAGPASAMATMPAAIPASTSTR